MATIRCYKCRGLKQVAGIGGIVKDCFVCDGSGRIEAEDAVITPIVEAAPPVVVAPAAEAVPLVAALDVATEQQVCADLESKLNDNAHMAASLGVSEELLTAVLDEPRIEPTQWRAKYRGVAGLLGANGIDEIMTKVDRASLRERYALMQPIAPRKVNLGAQQDSAVNTDVEYLKFKAQEDAKLKAEVQKKAKTK